MRGTGPLTWLSGTTGVPPDGTLVTRFWACVWTSSATVRARTVVETTRSFFDTALPRYSQQASFPFHEPRSHGEHGVSKFSPCLRVSVALDCQTRIRNRLAR
jgi:hypothetical protein